MSKLNRSPNTTVFAFTLTGTWKDAGYELTPKERNKTFNNLCNTHKFKTVLPMPDDLDYDKNGDMALRRILQISDYQINLEFRYKASSDKYSISAQQIHDGHHALPEEVIKSNLEEIFQGLFTVERSFRQQLYSPPNQ